MAADAEQDRRVRRRRAAWLGIVSVLLIVSGLLYLRTVTWGESQRPTTFCAGVGLAGTPSSSTPESAFADFLAASSALPPTQYWEREAGDGSAHYVNKTYDENGTGGYGYLSVQVDERDPMGQLTPGRWSVTGACVGPPSR